MDSRYNHLDYEQKIYQIWETSEGFNPNNTTVGRKKSSGKNQINSPEKRQTFSIIMPPPNANDPLHIGHAMFISLEDALIRFHRMLGDDTVWIPGTDHAGIETQFVFEKKLAKDGKSRFQFDRETLYQMIWDYVQENSGIAVDQMKKLGASADWSRFRFTLDPDIVKIVNQTFAKLHTDNLVYRGVRLVNFCTHCGTSYSELEVNYQDRVDPLYYIKYPLKNQPGTFVTVATVRPEPIFIDTHLAVHPSDPKTKHLIGQIALNPLTDAEMQIIGDEFVDPEFGTGIVKLTPAHDPNDFAVAQKHNLPIASAVGFDGRILPSGGKYAGLKVNAAREAVVADLIAKGLLDEAQTKKDYLHRIGTCYRCGRVIEPLLRAQFFIKVKPLVEKVQAAIANQEVTVHGAGYDKILNHWLANLKDWNISRQIVWGIRIPVWYSMTENPEMQINYLDQDGQLQKRQAQDISENELETVKKGLQQLIAPDTATFVVSPTPPGENYLQETDTFDTWFSSGQWPVVTLKTTQSDDFARFYPTSVMETGYDILPFWVMRMLLLGLYTTGQVPFHQVYLHGLIRDQKGQKMSKSKGNVINPLTIVDTHGADALRMALIIRSTPGLDKSVGEGDFKAMRNFTNKIWNAVRFIMTFEEKNPNSPAAESHEAAYLNQIESVVTQVTSHLHDLKLGLAADTLYNEFWHQFCDVAIEDAKAGKISASALKSGLKTYLKLLHPFVPFVTEATWQELHPSTDKNANLLMLSEWPAASPVASITKTPDS